MERDNIIKSVKTPLAFFALALLVTEGLLIALVGKANGLDFTLLVVGMLLVLLVLITIVFLLFRRRPISEEASKDVFVGIVDEYQSIVDGIMAQPLDGQTDEVLLGQIQGLVNTVQGFRRFSLSLQQLLNGQVNDLSGYVRQLTEKDRIQLSSDERKRLTIMLNGIRTSLPGKIREAEFEEERVRALLRQGREARNKPRAKSNTPQATAQS